MIRVIASCLTLALLSGQARADDLVGSAAFSNELYRVDSTTGASTLIGTYKLATPNEFGMPVVARDTNGILYGISNSSNVSSLYKLNDQTAAATQVFTIQTGPVTPAGCAVDPTTNDLYFTNTFGFVPWPTLHRMSLSNGQVTVLGNIGPMISDSQSGLAFTPNGNLYGVNISQNALWRVDKTDPSGSSFMVGAFGAGVDVKKGASIFYDATISSLVLYTAGGSGAFFQVDALTGATTQIAGVSGINPTMSDFTGTNCQGSAIAYNSGCAGTGGFVPALSMSGCPLVGAQVNLNVSNGLGGSAGLLFFGLNQASLPVGGGCNLNVSPLLPAIISLSLGGVGPGAGGLSIPAVLPPSVAGANFTMQVFVIDGGVPLGASASNGLEVSIP